MSWTKLSAPPLLFLGRGRNKAPPLRVDNFICPPLPGLRLKKVPPTPQNIRPSPMSNEYPLSHNYFYIHLLFTTQFGSVLKAQLPNNSVYLRAQEILVMI